MKVLLVSDLYPPSHGGMELHVERLARHLVVHGLEVRVFAGARSDWAGLRAGIPVRRVRPSLAGIPRVYADSDRPYHPPWVDRRFLTELQREIADYRPAVVHAHGWSCFSARAAARSTPTALVVTLHDYGLLCPKKTLLRDGATAENASGVRCCRCPRGSDELRAFPRITLGLGLAAARRARLFQVGTRFLAVSPYVRERHVAAGIAPGDSIRVVPNFVEDRATGMPGNAGRASDERYALYVGPGEPHKGLHVLERLYVDADARLPRLIVAGTSRGSPGVPGISYLGHVPRADVQQLLRDAALLVVPSVWAEPCPTVILEGLAAGVPIVATAVGGVPFLLQDGLVGRLASPNDPDSLRREMITVCTNQSLRASLSASGPRAVQPFTAASVVPEIISEYQRARRPEGTPASV